MKRQIALILSMCIISLCAYSQDTLNLLPPTNLQGISPAQTDYIHLTWAAPQDTTTFDSIPAGILGYNIYRDSLLLGYVDEPALEYYDLEVPWAILTYHISAVYDLTYYGHPGETGESVWEGPVTIDLTGNICPLPFVENFTTGLFETNQWIADGTNWRIAGQAGNPAPSAEFRNMPPQTNYSFSLTSEELRATGFIAGQIFLDYDLKLDDNAATGQEKLLVEVYNGTLWTIITIDSASGDRDWELQQVDITDVAKGHLFKVRFTATGINTSDINYWQIDNIHVYRECAAPLNLQVSNPSPMSGCNLLLEWDEPYEPEPGTLPLHDRGILGFNIYRDDQLIATTTETSYLDNDTILNNIGMAFCYNVTALYDDCESGFSNLDCEIPCPVGVKEVKLNSAEIYPNPGKEIVTIKVTDDINRFIVYDILGNELTSVDIDPQRLSIPLKVANFDNGIYPIRFITKSGKSISRKLVVFH